jgi:hypothetical protein
MFSTPWAVLWLHLKCLDVAMFPRTAMLGENQRTLEVELAAIKLVRPRVTPTRFRVGALIATIVVVEVVPSSLRQVAVP